MKKYASTIIGEAKSAFLIAKANNIMELEDVIQEIHLYLFQHWETIVNKARNMKAVIRIISRRTAFRYINKQRKISFETRDFSDE